MRPGVRGCEHPGALVRSERLAFLACNSARRRAANFLVSASSAAASEVGLDERLDLRALGGREVFEFAEGVGGEFGVVGFHGAVRMGRSKSGTGCSRSRARSFFSPVWMRKPMFVTLSFVTSAISR